MAKVAVQKIEKSPDNGVVALLQWLTYALWGLFVGSLLWLTGIVLWPVVVKDAPSAPSELLSFALASSLVLLVLAIIADYWYSRYEPVQKRGAANAIMIVHAVLFTLIGVGLVVTIMYNLIALMVGVDGAEDARLAVTLTALVGVAGFGALLARILLPFKRSWLRDVFRVAMAVLGIGFIIAALAGPASQTRLSAKDRVLEKGLDVLAMEINTYATKNNKLPASLKDVPLDGSHYSYYDNRYDDAKSVVEKGLVTYKPNTKPSTKANYPSDYIEKMKLDSTAAVAPARDGTVFYYQLCATFNTARNTDRGSVEPAPVFDSGQISPNTYSHKKGEQCYDLQTMYAY